MPQSSPSVLIIRLDGIGDALALTPLIAALEDHSVAVDAVLAEGNARIFSTRALRNVDVAPFALRSSTADNLRRIDAFGEALRARRYESVLVATEDPGGYRLAHRIGARHRIGFANGLRKPFKSLWVRSMLTRTLYRRAALDASGVHECETLFRLGRGLTREVQPTRIAARLRPLVLDPDIARDDRVAVQVTAKWQRFGIDASGVATLVRRLVPSFTVQCIAPAQEHAFADAVAADSGVAVERHSDVRSWKESIASARALVAPDSGATHVAGMVGTPVVAIFPPMRHAEWQVARWHPWAAPWRAVIAQGDWMERTLRALETLTSSDRV